MMRKLLLTPIFAISLVMPVMAQDLPPAEPVVPKPRIEIQVPAFSVRRFEGETLTGEYRCRIGKKTTPTRTGSGIISARFNPTYFRYDKGEKAGEIIEYSRIRRYLGGPVMKTIKIPYHQKIRGLELRINGTVSGQIIHSTTNPETVAHVYSSGCLGLYEDDMLALFNMTDKQTPVTILYDLIEFDGQNFHFYRDVYNRRISMQTILRKLLTEQKLIFTEEMETALLAEGLSKGQVNLDEFLASYENNWL